MDRLLEELFAYLTNPRSHAVGDNELFARLAVERPVLCWEPLWIVSRHELVTALAADPRCVMRLPEISMDTNGLNGRIAAITRALMPVQPPQEHQRLRRLVSPAFAARSANRLREQVNRIVDDLFVEPLERGWCDFVEEICVPLPVFTTATLLGIPRADWPLVLGWGRHLNRLIIEQINSIIPSAGADSTALDPGVDRAVGGADTASALDEMTGYIEDLVDARRRRPGEDLISRLASQAAEEDGALTHGELVALVVLLFMTGLDTVGSALANAVLALTRHQSVWQQVLDDPGLARNAYAEAIRLHPPLPFMSRFAEADIPVGRTVIPAGSIVLLGYGPASLDPAVFPDPTRFDLFRDASKALPFGHGPHYCLGAAAALIQGESVVRKLARTSPEFSLSGEPGPRRQEFAFDTASELRLRLPGKRRGRTSCAVTPS